MNQGCGFAKSTGTLLIERGTDSATRNHGLKVSQCQVGRSTILVRPEQIFDYFCFGLNILKCPMPVCFFAVTSPRHSSIFKILCSATVWYSDWRIYIALTTWRALFECHLIQDCHCYCDKIHRLLLTLDFLFTIPLEVAGSEPEFLFQIVEYRTYQPGMNPDVKMQSNFF